MQYTLVYIQFQMKITPKYHVQKPISHFHLSSVLFLKYIQRLDHVALCQMGPSDGRAVWNRATSWQEVVNGKIQRLSWGAGGFIEKLHQMLCCVHPTFVLFVVYMVFNVAVGPSIRWRNTKKIPTKASCQGLSSLKGGCTELDKREPREVSKNPRKFWEGCS